MPFNGAPPNLKVALRSLIRSHAQNFKIYPLYVSVPYDVCCSRIKLKRESDKVKYNTKTLTDSDLQVILQDYGFSFPRRTGKQQIIPGNSFFYGMCSCNTLGRKCKLAFHNDCIISFALGHVTKLNGTNFRVSTYIHPFHKLHLNCTKNITDYSRTQNDDTAR